MIESFFDFLFMVCFKLVMKFLVVIGVYFFFFVVIYLVFLWIL